MAPILQIRHYPADMEEYTSGLFLCVSCLQIHGLLEYKKEVKKHLFTIYGYEFVQAVTPPKPKP